MRARVRSSVARSAGLAARRPATARRHATTPALALAALATRTSAVAARPHVAPRPATRAARATTLAAADATQSGQTAPIARTWTPRSPSETTAPAAASVSGARRSFPAGPRAIAGPSVVQN